MKEGVVRSFNKGDRVIALTSLGHVVNPGTKGTITHVSTFRGLVSVRFDNEAEVQGVKLKQVAHG